MNGAKAARITLGALGVGVMAYGVVGFATAREITARTEIGQWLLAGVIAHDALLAPAVFLLGAIAHRITGARLRARLAAVLLIGGSLVLITLPAVARKGDNPNHTVLPLDYARNLGVLLAALAGAIVLLSATDALRNRRRSRRPLPAPEPQPQPQPGAESEPEPHQAPPRPEPPQPEPSRPAPPQPKPPHVPE